MTEATGGGPVDRVVALCREVLVPAGVDGASVALVTRQGVHSTVAATDEVAAALEDAQFTLGEGPCVDAARSRSPVLVEDLHDRRQGVQARWPGFLEAAEEHGMRALFALPLRIGAVALGAMALYRRAPGPMTRGQLRAALLAADATALVLLDLAAGVDPLPAGDEGAPDPLPGMRLHLHAAAGMVTVQMGTTIEDALARIRAAAFAQGRSVDEVADDIVAGRLRFHQEDR